MRDLTGWPIEHLCRFHLLGWHRELHGMCAVIEGRVQKKSLAGHLSRGQVEPQHLERNHAMLVAEMHRRGWPSGLDHRSPLAQPEGAPVGVANLAANVTKLSCCPGCRGSKDKNGWDGTPAKH